MAAAYVTMTNAALGATHDYPNRTDVIAYWQSRGWVLVDPGVPSPPPYDPAFDTSVAALVTTPSSTTKAALGAALGSADPVLSGFVYDGSGNLTQYAEDGITITLTYNSDGTVATSQRGTATAKAFSYSGGNLVGVA